MVNSGKPNARDQLPNLINSMTAPTTALAVSLVIVGALGADEVNAQLMRQPEGSVYFKAIIGLSALVSLFVTFGAARLQLVWRLLLWPVNFCVLVGLSFAGNNFYQAMRVPVQFSHAVQTQVIPGNAQ